MSTSQLTCKNCGSDRVAEFCSHCGQKTITSRYTTKSFFIKFLSAFNLEKGFLYTIKMLFINPGELINSYWEGKTKSYYNPLNYLLILIGAGTVLILWLGIFDVNVQSTNEALGINHANAKTMGLQKAIMDYTAQYTNIISLFMLPFMSLFSKWYFYKRKKYYGEHLIMNSFLFAQSSAISILTLPVFLIAPGLTKYFTVIGVFLFLIYYSFALKSTFKSTAFKSILGSLVVFSGGYFCFILFFSIITAVIMVILVANGVNLEGLAK